jgi:hypothetical protein
MEKLGTRMSRPMSAFPSLEHRAANSQSCVARLGFGFMNLLHFSVSHLSVKHSVEVQTTEKLLTEKSRPD